MATPRELTARGPARGSVEVPPSKSSSNRYLNLALLSPGETRIERLLAADDTEAFLGAIRGIGRSVEVTHADRRSPAPAQDVLIGPRSVPSREAEVFCRASGTMLRFLLAALATEPGRFRLDGVERLRERPVAPLVAALRSLGAEIRCLGVEGFAPLEIDGGELRGGAVELASGDSSQYASALVMAGTRARSPLEIRVPGLVSSPYLDLTVQAIRDFGGRARWDGEGSCRVEPGLAGAGEVRVEGDFSSACYFAAGAALAGGSVELHGLRRESRQGDRRFLDLLGEMGARLAWSGGVLSVAGGGALTGVESDLSAMPDQVPTLAALAPFARGTTRITGVPHLRLKESDRLAGMAAALRAAGAQVTEQPDGLVIPGAWAEGSGAGVPVDPVVLETLDDHRLAMSFALLGLGRRGITVADPSVVAKSYPRFWEDFGRVFGG